MEIEVLKERIAKKEAQIEKIDRRIKKWSVNMTADDINFVKENTHVKYGDWIRARNNRYTYEQLRDIEPDELRSALIDRDEAVVTLDKYKNALTMVEKQADKLSEEKVQIIWDFLQNWKKEAAEDVRENTVLIDKYYDANSRSSAMYNGARRYQREHTEEEYNEYIAEMKRLDQLEKQYRNSVYSITWLVYNFRTKSVDENKLNELLDKEVEVKYLNMISKITHITGEITDATDLSIDGRGEINGTIIGEKGKARINTILAGGDNAGIVVNVKRGPIRHFRMLIKEVK